MRMLTSNSCKVLPKTKIQSHLFRSARCRESEERKFSLRLEEIVPQSRLILGSGREFGPKFGYFCGFWVAFRESANAKEASLRGISGRLVSG